MEVTQRRKLHEQSPEKSGKQSNSPPKMTGMKEVISNLFKEEGEEVEMNRISRKDTKRSQI